MLLLANALASVSRGAPSQPCAFKALWFSDNPFLLTSSNEEDALVVILRFIHSSSRWLRYCLFGALNAQVCFLLSLRIHLLNLQVVTLCMWTNQRVGRFLSQEAASLTETKSTTVLHSHPRRITGLPIELRLKILEYLVPEDTVVKAVGYSDGHRNLFRVKERGYCPLPIMLTCKQFRLDMQDVYFRKVSICFKAAFPSAFDGDMATFANSYFKTNVRNVKISDPNLQRRHKISSAFQNARIEYQDKGASGARKSAYYFI